MFNLLKNKVSEFLEKLTKKEPQQKRQEIAGQQREKNEIQQQIDKDGQNKTEEKNNKNFGVNQGKKIAQKDEKDWNKIEKAALKDKKELKPQIGIFKQIKNIFKEEIEIEKKDIEQLLAELEISLLEADVAYPVANEIVKQLEKRLVGKKIEKSLLESKLKEEIKQTFLDILNTNKKDFEEMIYQFLVEKKKPIKILFVGPNGAGKTTTIAKISQYLTSKGYGLVISASDTFRAAAIEQLEAHCQNMGIKLIKNKYGSDPASVAFDAIKYAKANNIDFVLIDTAGRQDTNVNLIDELKKIVRVTQPEIKIYVGESIAGNALIEQVSVFNNAIGLDGAILTKLDCDAKGGTALSLAYSTRVPIIFFGVGQRYLDLKKFEAEWIVNRIIPN
ncbi:MAG: signal recognition particle-docking protein FtsY [Candidatus Omnitrophica bacterium]|nr:signal recognition particle-docking protein FtsY [Candidatus Omnitrophota bacterium]